MKAIAKREFKAYFSSPVGYVCVALMCALFGFYYYQVMLYAASSNIPNIYGMMFTWCMMIIPIITMRSMSDDRRNKTDQALLTAPVGLIPLVFGKFLGALAVYGIGLAMSLFPCVVLSFFAQPAWGMVFGCVIGSLLYGGAMLSIGIFLSCLTESQVIAAVSTFAVAFFLMIADQLASLTNSPVFIKIVEWISFNTRYAPFFKGIFDLSGAVFFLSVAAIFIFLTARRLESKRWS